MTLNIEISDKYRITSDEMQIVIQRKHTVDPTKAPGFNPEIHSADLRTEWRNWKYCGKVEVALDIILGQEIRESDATSLKQLRDEISAFRREINAKLDGEY